MLRSPARLVGLALACAGLMLTGAQAAAIVPPSDCGKLTVEGKRYSVKADQLRCSTVRSYARRYLATGRRPRGFRCKNYPSTTKLKFRCDKRVQVFFAIRR